MGFLGFWISGFLSLSIPEFPNKNLLLYFNNYLFLQEGKTVS